MKTFIPVSRVEGVASRQAHCDLPAGHLRTRDEQGRVLRPGRVLPSSASADGLDRVRRPAASARIRPDAAAGRDGQSLGGRRGPGATHPAAFVSGSASQSMDHLARNADGDELLFVHERRGRALLRLRAPGACGRRLRDDAARRRCGGSRSPQPIDVLLIESTNASYMLPDKGLVGPHAIFDPAMLDTPRIDEAFKAQQSTTQGWQVEVKRRGAISRITYPFNPLDAIGWHGELCAGAAQRARHPSAHEPSLPPAAVGAHDLPVVALRRLHVRAAAVRDRPGRAEGAVLPQQRRLRRSHLLSRAATSSAATTSTRACSRSTRRASRTARIRRRSRGCSSRPSPRPTSTR